MSTRSRVILEAENGKYYTIYIHHDGYIEGVGEGLFEYYKDRKKVRKLISLGDLSCLGDTLENCLSYFSWSLENTPYRVLEKSEIDNFLSNICKDGWEEYLYLFNENEETWYVYDIDTSTYDKNKWESLKDKIE